MPQARNNRASAPNRGDPLICLCNEVPRSAICRAIGSGACSLAQIFDATFAGCGPCGGSCQPELAKLLYEEQAKNSKRRAES